MTDPSPSLLAKGRVHFLLIVAITAAAVVFRFATRLWLVDRPITVGMFTQPLILGWLVFELWQGKNWARIVLAILYVIGVIGAAAITATIWLSTPWPFRLLLLFMILLGSLSVLVLAFSNPLKAYLAHRRAGAA